MTFKNNIDPQELDEMTFNKPMNHCPNCGVAVEDPRSTEGLTLCGGGAVGDELWPATHESIKAGIYAIVNRSTNSQLVVWDYSTNAQAVVQAFVHDPNNFGDERTWDIGRGGPKSTDLTMMSHFRYDRFLNVGPHVSQERNTVRVIPVPQSPTSYYISPNMGNPTLVISDPNPRGTNGWPVSMIELRDIYQDTWCAQWRLIPVHK